MNKLVGFGSDGAADMMGKNTGLITLMQNDHPEIIGVNCLAHSLELAFKDVFESDKLYLQLTTLLHYYLGFTIIIKIILNKENV